MGFIRRRTRRRTAMIAGGMAYEAGRNRQAEADEGAAAPAAPAPAPEAAPDATSELERLASLHQSGALSDDEFAAAKAKILGS